MPCFTSSRLEVLIIENAVEKDLINTNVPMMHFNVPFSVPVLIQYLYY